MHGTPCTAPCTTQDEDREALRTEVAAAGLAAAASGVVGGRAGKSGAVGGDSEFMTLTGEMNESEWGQAGDHAKVAPVEAAGRSGTPEITAAEGDTGASKGSAAGWGGWLLEKVGGLGSGENATRDVAVAVAAAVVVYAVYRERRNIKKALQKRVGSALGMVSEMGRMAFSLTPSPATSGYRPAAR